MNYNKSTKLGIAGIIGLGATSITCGAIRGFQEEVNGIAHPNLESTLVKTGVYLPLGVGTVIGTGTGVAYSINAERGQDGRLSMPLGAGIAGLIAGGSLGFVCTFVGYATGRIVGNYMKS